MAAYILTPSAQQDVASIRDYLAGAPQLIRNRAIDKLIATFRQAAQFSESGILSLNFRAKPSSCTAFLRYPCRVFYYPATSSLQIVAVIHGKRDLHTVLATR